MKMKKKLLLLSTFALFSLDKHSAGQGISCCKAGVIKTGSNTNVKNFTFDMMKGESAEILAMMENEMSTHIVKDINPGITLSANLNELKNTRYVKFEENNDKQTKELFSYVVKYVNNFNTESVPTYYILKNYSSFKSYNGFSKTYFPVARKIEGVYVYDCCLYIDHESSLTDIGNLFNVLNGNEKIFTLLIPEFIYFTEKQQNKFYEDLKKSESQKQLVENASIDEIKKVEEITKRQKEATDSFVFKDGVKRTRDEIIADIETVKNNNGSISLYKMSLGVGNKHIFDNNKELAQAFANRGIYRVNEITRIIKLDNDNSLTVIEQTLIVTTEKSIKEEEKNREKNSTK